MLAGCTQVVALGGDGTMDEVALALLHTPTALALHDLRDFPVPPESTADEPPAETVTA